MRGGVGPRAPGRWRARDSRPRPRRPRQSAGGGPRRGSGLDHRGDGGGIYRCGPRVSSSDVGLPGACGRGTAGGSRRGVRLGDAGCGRGSRARGDRRAGALCRRRDGALGCCADCGHRLAGLGPAARRGAIGRGPGRSLRRLGAAAGRRGQRPCHRPGRTQSGDAGGRRPRPRNDPPRGAAAAIRGGGGRRTRGPAPCPRGGPSRHR